MTELPLAEWKQRLQAEKAGLHNEFTLRHRAGRLLRQNARLHDRLLRDIWNAMGCGSGAALAAVGGYGRGELYPYSDIDLLILLSGDPSPAQQTRLETLIGLLWDIGMEVGHSVRTLTECIEEARLDITVQTNLLEARLLAGDESLFGDMTASLRANLDTQTFIEAKYLEQQNRHARFFDSASSLEPNLKESPGGLRDMQTILWMSQGCGIGNDWKDLIAAGLVGADEAKFILRQQSYIQQLRIRLHLLARRKEDRLLFDYQQELAAQFGLHDKPGRRASELLMQRYYRAARTITQANEMLIRALEGKVFEQACEQLTPPHRHFHIVNNLLEINAPDTYRTHPDMIFETFLLLGRHPELAGLGPVSLRGLLQARRIIDVKFRANAFHRQQFLDIFRLPSGITRALRRMNQSGILGRYLPAFGRIVGQMQHDLFHVYTVDQHILTVLRNIRRFSVAELAHEFPLASRLISEFDKPELLYLAALFHDIAKGRGGDHSQLGRADARRFCQQHGLDADDTELVVWLVEHHLTMSATAQKQDLSDPHVIRHFAELAGTPRRLAALYLLTVADIRGTSPKVWNAWKANLLESLYHATQRALNGGTEKPDSVMQHKQQEALAILRLYAFSEALTRQFWQKLDTGYFLRHDAQEIAWHARQLQTSTDTSTAIVRARLSPIGQGLQVLIYTPDQQDLFARICSFFERANYTVAEAKVSTTRHGYALDSFQVLDDADRGLHYRDVLSYVEYELAQELNAHTPLPLPLNGRISRHMKHYPLRPDVQLSQDERGQYHVLQVTAGDRPGLLSRIARVFLDHDINLVTAKINTLGERAEDTFLVSGGNLNEEKRVIEFEQALIAALN